MDLPGKIFMKLPEISIIVPVYNVENYLRDCLNSIFRQTFDNFELICINDGSTDSSGQILDEISEKNSQMKVFHTENSGLSAARNFGLSLAQGKYIVFIDSDDSIVPNYLEILYAEMEISQADLVACSRKYVPVIQKWEKAVVIPENIQRFEGDIFGRLLRREFRLGVEAYGVLYRKDLLPAAPYIPGLIYEDYCFFHTGYFKNLQKISIVNLNLYMITLSANSIMRSSFNSKKLASFFTILQEVKKHIGNFDPIYHKRIFYLVQNTVIRRTLRELLQMPEGDEKNNLFQQFRDYFRDGLRRGSITPGSLKFKYKILAIVTRYSNNVKVFSKAATILF